MTARIPFRPAGFVSLIALVVLATVTGQPAQAQTEAAESFECLIEPNAVVKVASSVDGVVDEVLVEPGTTVAKGDVIARLRSEVEQTNVELARIRADYDVAVELRTAQAELARRKMERDVELADKSVVSASALDESVTEASIAEMSVSEARFEQRLARLELARAEALLEQKVIRSPIDAVVTERLLWPGEYAHEQAQVVTLAELDPLAVRVFVPTSLYGQVRPGQSAIIRPEPPVGGEYSARVDTVDRVFDAASGTFGVRLKLPNPDFEMPAGFRCSLEFSQQVDDEDGDG